MKNMEIKMRVENPRSVYKQWAQLYSYSNNYVEIVPTKATDERMNQSKMTKDQRNRFLSAYQAINNSGLLGPLVEYHADMTHLMHASMGEAGVQRFLPWHRVYLAELEEALQTHDSSVVIPYWDWTVDQKIPQWLEGFTPSVLVNGNLLTVERQPGVLPFGGRPSKLPLQPDVDVTHSKTTYRAFTLALEAGAEPPGTDEIVTGMHNEVHVWVGGTMASVPTAPVDPMFWMHHANCDRLWDEWQKENPGKNPTLNGALAVMDPWSYTEVDTRDTINFGYIYK
jgi:tyrosinase